MPSIYPGPYLTNNSNDYITFTGLPIVQEAIAAASIGVVTQGHTNMWYIDGKYFEEFNTVATSVVAPSMGTILNNGLNIGALCNAANKEIEITQGNNAAIKNCFVTRTSPAFFVRATFNINTLADVTELSVGFRKVQTYATSPLSTYTDYAAIGVSGTAGLIQTQTGIASTYVKTSTTNSATAVTNFTLQVNIDGSGNVTYLWANANGLLTSPATVVAAQMGASLNFVPWIHYTVSAAAAAEVDLVSYCCGLL
jgi:hypothetical protein